MEIPDAAQSVNKIVAHMHSIARSNQPASIGLGQVVKELPDLMIAYNGIILTKEQLYVDKFLLAGYARAVKGDTKLDDVEGDIRTATQNRRGGSDKPSFVSHNHKINDSYKADAKGAYEASAMYTDYGLQVGDFVALLPINGGQKFIVTAAAVYLPDFKPPENSTF